MLSFTNTYPGFNQNVNCQWDKEVARHRFVTFQNSLLQIVKILDKDQHYKPPIIDKQIVHICHCWV